MVESTDWDECSDKELFDKMNESLNGTCIILLHETGRRGDEYTIFSKARGTIIEQTWCIKALHWWVKAYLYCIKQR